MDAKEARKQALEITSKKEKDQYASIESRIYTATGEGKLECYYYGTIMPAVKIKLESEGFKISSMNDGRNGTDTTIKW